MLEHIIRALPSAAEYLMVGVLWLVVMRNHLAGLQPPRWEDMQPVPGMPDMRRQTGRQLAREIAAHIAWHVPPYVCFLQALTTLSQTTGGA